jgi:hypothetical protein
MRGPSRLWVAKGLVVAGALAGCGDDDGPSQTCQRDTGESNASGNVTAAYAAEVTGDASVSALTYYTDAGPQTLANPVLPFSTTVQLETAHARIQATGDPGSTGSFQIGYQVSDETGLLEQTSVNCP